MANAINIIIDKKRPMQSGSEFVEIETDGGKSIRIGERMSDGNFTKIRITIEDIEKVVFNEENN